MEDVDLVDRIVPMGKIAVESIDRYLRLARPYLARFEPESEWLFVSKSGQKMDGSPVLNAVQRHARAAGIIKGWGRIRSGVPARPR